MKKNMGNADRIIRLLIAITFALLYFMDVVSGTLGVVLLVIAGVFALTSIINFCPIYRIFGISSCPVKKQ
ncbi:YgaP family membrane protein [Yeosuana marina]|uniref:YgaP family membrane protein n=1 Tax=Yeosuana marina TaxID=1565536 RepID=UPI00142318A3|nr:DUF2892 domain-containing protein [Yeosuana marina]